VAKAGGKNRSSASSRQTRGKSVKLVWAEYVRTRKILVRAREEGVPKVLISC